MDVILQPCSDRQAHQHYNDTIENYVSLESIAPGLPSEDATEIRKYYPDGKMPVWGLQPPKRKIWDKMSAGDIVLFYRNKRIIAKGTVSYKMQNAQVAEQLWGRDKQGRTWEYIYLLDELTPQNIDIKEFNHTVGYKDNYIVQGALICRPDVRRKILDRFLFRSDVYYPNFSETCMDDLVQEEERIAKIMCKNSLDTRVTAAAREEQAYLRWNLFHNQKVARCGICGRLLPVPLLVAAHIKKRCACSIEEKKDIPNIVMPMCKLYGCDDLYERGFIYLEDGVIRTDLNGYDTEALRSVLQELEGKTCEYYTKDTEKYFEYHRHHRK